MRSDSRNFKYYVGESEDMAPEGNPDRVKTAETAFEILETLKRLDGAGISAVAAETGLAKSTVHRHLHTLERQEWVVRRGDLYRVGFRFLEFGEHARTRKRGYGMAKEKVAELAEETDERAQFLVEEHGRGVYIFREWGRKAVQTDPGIGKRAPMHATAAGKAILAHAPEWAVEAVLERRTLDRYTDQTITARPRLFEEFERIRERGYAINDEEKLEGVRAVGVAVREPNGQVLGGLSVSAPSNRLKGDRLTDEIPDLLRGVASELELNLAHT